MTRKEELKEIIRVANEELSAIRVTEAGERLTAVIGRYFKFCNGDRCTYGHPTRLDRGDAMGLQFIDNRYNAIGVYPDTYISCTMDGWAEITREEFEAAWNSLKKVIEEIKF